MADLQRLLLTDKSHERVTEPSRGAWARAEMAEDSSELTDSINATWIVQTQVQSIVHITQRGGPPMQVYVCTLLGGGGGGGGGESLFVLRAAHLIEPCMHAHTGNLIFHSQVVHKHHS